MRIGVSAALVDGAFVPGDVDVEDGVVRALGVGSGGRGVVGLAAAIAPARDARTLQRQTGAGIAPQHQTGQRLTVPKNITLLRLPPYSPELNPIENVWEYLRGNQLSRRLWRTYDDIVQACCDAWNWLIADTVRVASITTRKWASVSS